MNNDRRVRPLATIGDWRKSRSATLATRTDKMIIINIFIDLQVDQAPSSDVTHRKPAIALKAYAIIHDTTCGVTP
jgi:hypothetical protein